MNEFIRRAREAFNDDFSAVALRIAIITWALVVVLAALFVKSKWVLAGILAWEVLP